jgi:hypothetical protein
MQFSTPCNAFFEGAGNGAELVVDLLAAIDGDAHVGQADLLELARLLLGDERAVGADDRAHPLAGRVAGKLDQILAHQGFAAGKQHDRGPRRRPNRR